MVTNWCVRFRKFFWSLEILTEFDYLNSIEKFGKVIGNRNEVFKMLRFKIFNLCDCKGLLVELAQKLLKKPLEFRLN